MNCRIEDTRWDGKTIVVLNDVRISEPYKVEDLQTIPGRNEKSLNHVTKLVSGYSCVIVGHTVIKDILCAISTSNFDV